MKAAALVLLVSAAALSGARAETYVSGFTPRYGTAPNPAYADEPNYRPPSRPPHSYEFVFGVEAWDPGWNPRDRRRGRHKHK